MKIDSVKCRKCGKQYINAFCELCEIKFLKEKIESANKCIFKLRKEIKELEPGRRDDDHSDVHNSIPQPRNPRERY